VTAQHSSAEGGDAIDWGGMRFHWRLLWTLAFNSLIAAFLTTIGYGGTLAINMAFSQCIGLSIFAMIELVVSFGRQHGRRLQGGRLAAAVALAVLLGALTGVVLAVLLIGVAQERDRALVAVLAQTGLIALVFGAIAGYYFFSRERLSRTRTRLQQQELRRLAVERDREATELRLLRAQVEPHMLFNTLAHVRSLIDSNPELGKEMLDHLIDYLRDALQHAREAGTVLGDEARVLENYLAMYRIRMGERLDYRIEIPDQLASEPLPPMLLQPLVENAVRHGVEPAVAGGAVTVSAQAENDWLTVTVRDTGVGLDHAAGGNGVGLANLRERLVALYGDRGQLRVAAAVDGGVVATLELPRCPQ